jgi:hypothetical protein
MGPVLICAEYPKESYGVGERFSLPLFVVNDLSCGLGEVSWGWNYCSGDTAWPRVGERRRSRRTRW